MVLGFKYSLLFHFSKCGYSTEIKTKQFHFIEYCKLIQPLGINSVCAFYKRKPIWTVYGITWSQVQLCFKQRNILLVILWGRSSGTRIDLRIWKQLPFIWEHNYLNKIFNVQRLREWNTKCIFIELHWNTCNKELIIILINSITPDITKHA